MSESLSIIEFLEDEYPGTKKLLPGDTFNRAVARSLALNVGFWHNFEFALS